MPEQDESGELTAIITGAGSGIGQATAILLLERGWNVAALDLHRKGLAELEARGAGARLFVRECDVADEAQVTAIVSDVASRFGRIDGVVNSAGMAADKHVFDTSAELFRKILDVNVVGTFLLGREAARHMAKAGRGAIVNVASIIGITGNRGQVAYGGSKAAVIGMTRSAAKELAPKVRVNAVAPGFIDTDMTRALGPEIFEERVAAVGLGRAGTPEEVAEAIAWLASDRARYVTGQVLGVDGGMVI